MHRPRAVNYVRTPSAQTSAQGPEEAATLPQRIRESVSGLVKGSFEPPSTGAVIGVLASLNASTAKAGSSSSSTGTGEASLALLSSSQYEQATSGESESFRSTNKGCRIGRINGQVAFDEFLAGPNKTDHKPDFTLDRPALSSDQQRGGSVGMTEDDLNKVRKWESREMQDENQSFTEHDDIDGAAVVALLLDPAFTVSQGPGSILELECAGAEGLSYSRLHTGKEPTRSLDTSHSSNPLDLVPDFGAPWSLSHLLSATPKGIYRKGRLQELGSWEVQPWFDVLDRYHDEVWGEMLPLVQEAREELKAANEKQPGLENGPAIRRLKMVLQHLGHSKSC